MKKAQNGVTLVALIITVIVLLIISSVVIGSIKNDGIIQKAGDAKSKYSEAQAKEKIQLGIQEYMLDHNGGFEADDFVSEVTKNKYVDEATGDGTSLTVDEYNFEITDVGTVKTETTPDDNNLEVQNALVNNAL